MKQQQQQQQIIFLNKTTATNNNNNACQHTHISHQSFSFVVESQSVLKLPAIFCITVINLQNKDVDLWNNAVIIQSLNLEEQDAQYFSRDYFDEVDDDRE